MPKTILLLEDTPREQKRLTKALEEAGYNVLWFENPMDCAYELKDKDDIHIDAIVSDWNMPKCTGINFLICLRYGKYEKARFASKLVKDTPFVMCSAHDEQSYIDESMRQGADFYQQKSSMYSLQPMIDFLKATLPS
tara:strand:+ start:87259 stop:87669 length:411 start_codon:yes stop_codon:yes gene_type:complete